MASMTCSAMGDGLSVIESEGTTSLKMKDRVLWTFVHRPEEGKPYFHPLHTVGGSLVTGLRPEDHPWHRGLWFSWKFIDGINYWEENRETGLSQGQTRLVSTDRRVMPDDRVCFTLQLAYAPEHGGEPVMTESREIVVHPPDEDGSYVIDWCATFHALEREVVLDRTPLPGEPGGQSWGGYAGLSLRMSSDFLGGTLRNDVGQVDEDTFRQPARWVSYTVPGKGCVLVMDHPSNLRFPAKWYLAPGMPYIGPAILHDAPYTMAANSTLSLRYRLIIADDPIDNQAAAQSWQAWVDQTGSSDTSEECD